MVTNSQWGGAKRLAKGAALGAFLTAVLAGFSSPSFAKDSFSLSSFNESLTVAVGNDFSFFKLYEKTLGPFGLFNIEDETTITITGGEGNSFDDSDLGLGADPLSDINNGYGKLSIGKVADWDYNIFDDGYGAKEKEESLNLILDNVALKNLGRTNSSLQGEKGQRQQSITYIEGTNVSQAEQNNLTLNIHSSDNKVLKGPVCP